MVLTQPLILILSVRQDAIGFLSRCFKGRAHVLVATGAEQALARIHSARQPDILLLEPAFVGFDGFQFCLKLKAVPETRNIPVMFVGNPDGPEEQARGLTVGAADFLTEPFHCDLIRARVEAQLELKRHKEHLEALVAQQTAETLRTQEATLIAIAALAETRDPETGGHIHRTQRYVRLVAEELSRNPRFAEELTPERIELLYKSAPLHDVGKVGISDRILLKPGPLTEEEFAEVKKHALYGWNALKSANQHIGKGSFLRCAAEIALTHHERWDGTGYPRGLKGEQIPLSGRLMAIADVYDALISRRVYKPSLTHAEAVRIIARDSDRHFDPAVAEAFLAIEERIRTVALEMEEYVI